MKVRLAALVLAAALLLALCALPAAAAPPAVPEIAAPSAVLIDRQSGTVLYEKNAHERLAPASVTKIMTLLLVMEALDAGRISWDDTVTASEAAAAKGGSQVYLAVGEQMPLEEMVKSVVVSSANDCAAALAEHVAGSEAAFVDLMNTRAAELGMADTHFVNCTGLDDTPEAGEHLTSAYDIALMSRALLAHDRIRDYTTIWMDSVRGGQFGLSNTNKLVRFYPGTTGLKTGFTAAAGYCLSASAMRDGIEFLAVVLHCATSDERFSSAKTLLDYAFANFTNLTPELPETELPVVLGTPERVRCVLADTAPILAEKSAAAGAEQVLDLPESVEAPVAQGQQLGTLTIKSGDAVLAELPVIAETEAARLSWWEAAKVIFRRVCFG